MNYLTPTQVLNECVNQLYIKMKTGQKVVWEGPSVDNIKDLGTNQFSCDIGWGDGGVPDNGALFTFVPSTKKWIIQTKYFPSGRTGTKYFLQYDHEFPSNLCAKMNSMDASEAYKE